MYMYSTFPHQQDVLFYRLRDFLMLSFIGFKLRCVLSIVKCFKLVWILYVGLIEEHRRTINLAAFKHYFIKYVQSIVTIFTSYILW